MKPLSISLPLNCRWRSAFLVGLILTMIAVRAGAQAQTWTNNSPLNGARWQHTATLMTNGQVLIAGGVIYNMSGNFFNTNGAEIFDPVAGVCIAAGTMQSSRDTMRAVRLPNGQVLVMGGGGDSSSEVYDPGSDTWIDYKSMNDERQYHVAVLLTNGLVLCAGGYDQDTGNELSSAELYNPSTATWTSTASMPYAGDTLAGVVLTNGLVLVCGGYNSTNSAPTNAAALYNPSTHIWILTGPMKEARDGHAATLLANGKVLVEGGNYDNTAEIYDPVAGTWSFAASMSDSHESVDATLLNNGTVLVTGDGDNNAEVYYPSANVWSNTAALPTAGYSQRQTLLANGNVVVTGGSVSQFNGPPLDVVETYITQLSTPTLTVAVAPSNGLASLHVQFTSPGTDGASYTVTNWSWIFGDGGVSTAQSPLHIYTNAGVYVPSLTAYSQSGHTPLTILGLVSVTVTNPTVTATASPQAGLAGLSVHFTCSGTDSVGNTVTNWSWVFGDGGLATNQNPTHIYTNAGSYSPSLTAYSTFGKTALTVIGLGSITVTNPILTVSDTPQAGEVPLAVQFTSPGTDSAGFTVTNWSWNFGDGGVSTQQSPKHIYTTAGTYTPTLTAMSTFGRSALTVAGLGQVMVSTPPNPFFRTVYRFTGGNDGTGVAPVIVSGNTLYGAAGGGTGGDGSLFAMNTDGTGFTNLFYFSNATGYAPSTPTLGGSNLCGTTYIYGSGGLGNVYVIRTNGTGFTNVYSFSTAGPGTGAEPLAGVVAQSNILYGLTEYGGAYTEGALFSVNESGGGFSDLNSFDPFTSGPTGSVNTDGLFPQSRLIASGSTLYGTAEGGGTNSAGTVFAYNFNTGFKILHWFTSDVTGTNKDGAFPFTGLVLSGNTLYGVTLQGGTNGNGVVYAINTDGSGFTTLYNFTGGTDGESPTGPLALWGNTLIGAANGGTTTNGTLFAIRTSGQGFTNLYNFNGGADGYNPAGALALSGNTLYGTASGGIANNGIIYTYTLQTPQLTILRAGTNVVLRWPAYFTGYTLQSNTNLATSTNWTSVLPLPVVVSGQNSVTNPAATKQTYYRLSQ